jgi:outer membrane receptor for ferrienterochelin and colicin
MKVPNERVSKTPLSRYFTSLLSLGWFILLGILAWHPLQGQSGLLISIVDTNQQPVIGALVQVENTGIGFVREMPTNTFGQVKLDGLSTSGTYDIRVPEGIFYAAGERTGLQLVSDKTTTLTLVLKDKSLALESITVVAGSQQTINTVNAQVASELSSTALRQLPLEGRDITRALYRLPNITQATGFYPEAPNVSINGANALYTNYQIDGLDNNENFLGGQRFAMPVGFTSGVTALTNNFSAEHGLTSNGVINITSRSGSNQTEGEVFYITRPGPVIDAPSAFAQRDLSGNQVKDGFQRHQVGFGLGGPLIKDRTFYYINAEHTTDLKQNLLNIPQLGINETVPGTNRFNYISGKIDQHWNVNFRSSLRINTGLVSIEQQGGGLEGGVTLPSAGYVQQRNSLNIALKNTYAKKNVGGADHFIYESHYQYGQFHWNYAEPLSEAGPNVTALDPVGQPLLITGYPDFVFNEKESTHLVQQKWTYYKANHRLKAGFQVKSSRFTLLGGGNPNGSYTIQLNPDQIETIRQSNLGSNLRPEDLPSDAEVLFYGIELRPQSFQNWQHIFSVYLEDLWSINPRLNLNYGLRYDYDHLSRGGNQRGDLNNLAPRISLNYKLDQRSSVRFGYGMYYDKIIYALYSDALQFNSNSADYRAQIQGLIDQGILPNDTDIAAVTNEGNLVASLPQVGYLQGPPAGQLQEQRENLFQNELRILNPDGYANPYSHQFMAGYQIQINEKSLIYVDLMHNRSFNLFRLRNLNAPAAWPLDPENVIPRTLEDADQSRPIPIYADDQGNYTILQGDTLRGIARNVVMTESKGRSNYYALNFTWQKERGQDDYDFRLMYTLSLLENNTEDINFRAMDSNDFGAESGPSINDRTHLIQGIFSYFPWQRWTLTLASLMQSGQPINRIPDATRYGTADLNGDGSAFGDAYVGNSDRSPGESRNSDRLPWSVTLDANAFYTLPLKGTEIEFGVQVFNLLNAENLSGYSNNATQSNQIQPGPSSSGVLIRRNAAPPRQFQFSVRAIF